VASAVIDSPSDGGHVISPIPVSGHIDGGSGGGQGKVVRCLVQQSGQDPQGREANVDSSDHWSTNIPVGFTGAATVSAQYVVDNMNVGAPASVGVTIDS
jgi:hypothetical protein